MRRLTTGLIIVLPAVLALQLNDWPSSRRPLSRRCLSRFLLVLFGVKFTESAGNLMELLRHRVSAVSGGFGEGEYTLFPDLR